MTQKTNDAPKSGRRKKKSDLSAKEWLRRAGFDDLADWIEKYEAGKKRERWEESKKRGKTTRRDWWEVLAGTPDGRPRRVGDRVFPILRAARRRMGLLPIKDALDAGPDAPPVPRKRVGGRWPEQAGE